MAPEARTAVPALVTPFWDGVSVGGLSLVGMGSAARLRLRVRRRGREVRLIRLDHPLDSDPLDAFGTFVLLINIHHFFIDGAIWKLRNPEVRRELFAHLGTAQMSKR